MQLKSAIPFNCKNIIKQNNDSNTFTEHHLFKTPYLFKSPYDSKSNFKRSCIGELQQQLRISQPHKNILKKNTLISV